MTISTQYFKPLNHIVRCELDQLKINPLTALIILSYFTVAAPLIFLGLSCLAGRVKEADLTDPKIDKVDSVSQKTISDALKTYQKGATELGNTFGAVKKEGLRRITEAADLGLANAQHHLGYLYNQSQIVQKDSEKGFEYYKKAADQDYTPALYAVGHSYINGNGVVKDKEKAVEYYKKAAIKGDADSCYALGHAYRYGEGVVQDKAQSFELIKIAADKGLDIAQYVVGCDYRSGKIVGKNNEEAIKYFKMAADQDYKYAKQALESMQGT